MIKKVKEILLLPKLKITIVNEGNQKEISDMYKDFVKPHAKFKIFKNKTLGVMLFELPNNVEEYEKKISGKNSVAYFSRRCKKMGYYTKYFNPNKHLQELYEINTSTDTRQGRKMTAHYLEKVEEQEQKDFIKWYGVYNSEDKLVGYIKLIKTPNLYLISGILGHYYYMKDNIMHLLLHDLIVDLIENKKQYDRINIMYDTYFGATEGLKLYKKKHCFMPYKVKWKYIVKEGTLTC